MIIKINITMRTDHDELTTKETSSSSSFIYNQMANWPLTMLYIKKYNKAQHRKR